MVVLDVGRCLVPCVPDVAEDIITNSSRADSSLSLLGNADCAHVVTPDLGGEIFCFIEGDESSYQMVNGAHSQLFCAV